MKSCVAAIVFAASVSLAGAGPYSHGLNDPTNIYDAPVPGFVGPDGIGMARLANDDGSYQNPLNYVNPLFFGWATNCPVYAPSDPSLPSGDFGDPSKALGPVTGDNFDVVSLGDLTADQITAGTAPGQITLTFARAIEDKPGADFVVFENALVAGSNTGGAGAGGVFADLGYVEVSSDGVNFARFPSASLTPSAVGAYGTIDPTNVDGLAGKHVNGYGDCWGTPFDLSALVSTAAVVSGQVNLNAIAYVRIVDIPGNGAFHDSSNRSIYDAWYTSGSGGFDLEAIGVISHEITFSQWEDLNGLASVQRGVAADPDNDLIPNLLEYAFSLLPLSPDNPNTALPAVVAQSDRIAISFSRDTRKTDLTYEVQASGDLAHWTPIARSASGASLAGVSPYAPAIADASDSAIASVGAIRRETVSDVVSFAQAPHGRFLRVQITAAQ